MKILIPKRETAPATHLNIEIVAKNAAQLGQRPVTFMLPGGPGMDHTVYLAYSCLLDVTDLVYHDPRGIGQSDKDDPATYTMENYVDDVEAIRRHLQLDKIIVLGKSYGSVCAGAYAIKYPMPVTQLILSAGAPSFHFKEVAKQNLQRWGTPEQIQACEKLWAGKFTSNEDLADFFKIMASMYAKNPNKDKFSLAKSAAGFSYQATNLGFGDFLNRFDYTADLHKIKCLTLLLAGELDWVNDVKFAELMAEKIPNSHLKIFTGSGHSMESDVGDAYFQEIRNFIKGQTQ